MSSEQLRREEERIQVKLLEKNSNKFALLCELGDLYDKEGRLLEAKDGYIRALVHAGSEPKRRGCEEKIEQLDRAMEHFTYSDADYAQSLNRVVSIYCYGRSGTHFFKSLLDGHPKIILTMLNGMKIFKLWDSLVQQRGEKVFREALEEVVTQIFDVFQEFFNEGEEYYETRLNGMCNMGDDRNEIFTIDKDRFQEKFTSIVNASESMNQKLFYQAVQLAAAYGIGYEYDFRTGIPIIAEGGIHFSMSVEATEKFLQVFPYTILLHMVRQPVQAFASSLKYLIKSKQATIDNLTANLIAIFADIPMKEEWIDRTRIVKLEELHLKPKEVLQAFCDFMDIEWSETLLQSTFGGIKWWNTATSQVLSGFNTKTISNSYDELLTSLDKFRIELLLRPKYKAWGYEIFEYSGYHGINIIYREPYKFEQFFGYDPIDKMMIRRITDKIIDKQLRHIVNTPEEEIIDFKGRMLLADKREK